MQLGMGNRLLRLQFHEFDDRPGVKEDSAQCCAIGHVIVSIAIGQYIRVNWQNGNRLYTQQKGTLTALCH